MNSSLARDGTVVGTVYGYVAVAANMILDRVIHRSNMQERGLDEMQVATWMQHDMQVRYICRCDTRRQYGYGVRGLVQTSEEIPVW